MAIGVVATGILADNPLFLPSVAEDLYSKSPRSQLRCPLQPPSHFVRRNYTEPIHQALSGVCDSHTVRKRTTLKTLIRTYGV